MSDLTHNALLPGVFAACVIVALLASALLLFPTTGIVTWAEYTKGVLLAAAAIVGASVAVGIVVATIVWLAVG